MIDHCKQLWSTIHYQKLVKKRVPIIKWLPQYNIKWFLGDLLAGLTVGITEIPQSIAYASLAGLPTQYGLYSGLLDGFIYAIFGGCKDLNIGPSSILSLMIQPTVAAAGPQAAILLTFLSGTIILILGLLNLGIVSSFFSQAVISGFIAAGCVQILSGQLVAILGLSGASDNLVHSAETVIYHIQETKIGDCVLGFSSLAFILVVKEITMRSRKVDPPLTKRRQHLNKFLYVLSLCRNGLIVIFGTALSYRLRESSPFTITGQISTGFPTVQLPPFSIVHNGTELNFVKLVTTYYGISLGFIPLLSILEALSIAKLFKKGIGLDATQEMLALGFCNFFSSFIGAMPVTGSFSRSLVNNASGVRTTMAGVFTSLLLLLAIAFLTSTFYFVPKATLAALLIGAALNVIEFRSLFLIWKTKKLDLLPYLITFLTSLFVGLDYGLFAGTAVNLLFVLYASARPKLQIVKSENGVITIIPKDTLYFPSAEHLRDVVLKRAGHDDTVVINGKHIESMDFTVAKALATMVRELELKNCTVFLTNFKPSVIKVCVGVKDEMKSLFYSEEAVKL